MRDVWYLRVLWSHDYADHPVELFSEIGPDGWERRRVERFRDGRLGWADEEHEVGGAVLAEARVGASLDEIDEQDEINEQDEFEASTIDAERFEWMWRQAVDG